jgi:hypothetical protein
LNGVFAVFWPAATRLRFLVSLPFRAGTGVTMILAIGVNLAVDFGNWVVWMAYVPDSKKWTENGSSGKRRESSQRAGERSMSARLANADKGRESSMSMGTSWSFPQPFGSGVATSRGKASYD